MCVCVCVCVCGCVCVCVCTCVCGGGGQMNYIYLGGDSVSFLWWGTTYAVQVKMFFSSRDWIFK